MLISVSFSFLDYVVAISCVLLVGLFSIQHHGTHRVAFLFAPIVTAWLLSIAGIGIYNIVQWNPQIFHALSPVYMVRLLKRTGYEGWLSLGGVVLSITGVETMFADLGHFSTLSVKVISSKSKYKSKKLMLSLVSVGIKLDMASRQKINLFWNLGDPLVQLANVTNVATGKSLRNTVMR